MGSLAVTVIDGCVPAATYSVVRFVPSIGYGTVALAVAGVAAALGDWSINGIPRAMHTSASDVLRSQILFIDSPLLQPARSWARP